MINRKMLASLSNKAAETERDYMNAIKENLMELDRTVKIPGDGGEGLSLDVMFDDNIWHYLIDGIRYEKDHDRVLVHYIGLNAAIMDDWMDWHELGDALDYLLDAIEWPEDVPEEGNTCEEFPILTLTRDDTYIAIRTDSLTDEQMENISQLMISAYLKDADFNERLRECAEQCGIKTEGK